MHSLAITSPPEWLLFSLTTSWPLVERELNRLFGPRMVLGGSCGLSLSGSLCFVYNGECEPFVLHTGLAFERFDVVPFYTYVEVAFPKDPPEGR